MEIRKQIDGVYEISANAQAFIIPSIKFTAKDLGSTIMDIKKDCDLNGISLSGNEEFPNLAIVSLEDLNTCSLDHGFKIGLLGSDEINVHAGEICCYIPDEVFQGKKEGDIIHWTFGCRSKYEPGDVSGKIKVLLHLDIKLNQLSFRYQNFGRFEDVLSRVCTRHMRVAG